MKLSDADMARCRQAGRARDAQKTSYPTSRQLRSGGTHTAGLVGELVYGRLIGQEPDWELVAQGRRGADFGTTNVKCSTRPALLVSPENLAKDIAAGVETYALVQWHEHDQTADYRGWANATEVAAAPINQSLPMPAHEIPADRLHPGTPRSGERDLPCTLCGKVVTVVGADWIDPDLYECQACRRNHEHPRQRTLADPSADSVREEWHGRYDPWMARIPF